MAIAVEFYERQEKEIYWRHYLYRFVYLNFSCSAIGNKNNGGLNNGDQPMMVPEWIADLISSIGGKSVLAHNLWICGIVLLLLSLFNGFFMYMRGKWTSQASEHAAKNIRDGLFDHLQNLPYDEHVKAETGDWIQRCTSDVETVRRFLAMQLVEIGRTVFLLTAALIIMFSLDIRMTFISMAVVPIVFAFSYMFFSRIRETFRLAD